MILLTATAKIAFAGESGDEIRLSFCGALRMASERNVEVIVSDERVKQAVARAGASLSPLLPQFTTSAYQNREKVNLESMGIDIPQINPLVGPFNAFDARMTLEQTLLDAASVARLRSACAGKKLSKEERRKAKEDAMALVADLYIEAERSGETVNAMNAVLLQARENLRIARKKIELGTGSDLEMLEADSGFEDARSRLSAAETRAIEKRLDLLASLGIPPEKRVIFEGEEGWSDFVIPQGEAILRARDNSPDVSVAKALQEERRRERLAEWMELLPKFSGLMDYGASGVTPDNAEATYTFGLKASFPVFEGGKTFFAIREAMSRLRESKARVDDTRSQSEARILKAIQSIEEARVLMESKASAWAFASKRYGLAEHRLRTGTGSTLDVTGAAAQGALAEDDKAEARAVYRLAQVHLAHAMGELENWIREDKIESV